MTRFDYDNDDGEGMPWGLWESVVSNALGGGRGQDALAAMEEALVALPERKLVRGHLARDGQVCAVGALVAHRRAQRDTVDIDVVIDAMAAGVRCWCGHGRDAHAEGKCTGKRWQDRACGCIEYDPETQDAWETVDAGRAEGLTSAVAWHLAYLNDESFREATDEERYERMLAWVRRAQGSDEGVDGRG